MRVFESVSCDSDTFSFQLPFPTLNRWTKEDIENLYWLYSSSTKTTDPIASILEAYKESGCGSGKSRESVLNQLLHQRIIGYNQFLRFLSWERVDNPDTNGQSICDVSSSTCSSLAMTGGRSVASKSPAIPPTSSLLEALRSANNGYSLSASGMVNSEANLPTSSTSGDVLEQEQLELSSMDITVAELVAQLLMEGQDLGWLQKQVLEACFVKLVLEDKEKKRLDPEAVIEEKKQEDGRSYVMEPVPHRYACELTFIMMLSLYENPNMLVWYSLLTLGLSRSGPLHSNRSLDEMAGDSPDVSTLHPPPP